MSTLMRIGRKKHETQIAIEFALAGNTKHRCPRCSKQVSALVLFFIKLFSNSLILGESDGRLLEELETLTYNPHNSLSERELDQYFAIAKAIGLFVQAVDSCQEGLDDRDEDLATGEDNDLELQKSWQILDTVSARNFLGDHSNSHASSHGNNATASSSFLGTSNLNTSASTANASSPGNAAVTTLAGASANNAGGSSGNTSATTTPEKIPSITTRHQRLQQQKEQQINLDSGETGSMISTNSSSTPTANASSPLPLSPLKPTTNTRILNAMKGLVSVHDKCC